MMLNRKFSSVLLPKRETRHIMLCISVDKEMQIVCQEQLLVLMCFTIYGSSS